MSSFILSYFCVFFFLFLRENQKKKQRVFCNLHMFVLIYCIFCYTSNWLQITHLISYHFFFFRVYYQKRKWLLIKLLGGIADSIIMWSNFRINISEKKIYNNKNKGQYGCGDQKHELDIEDQNHQSILTWNVWTPHQQHNNFLLSKTKLLLKYLKDRIF